MAPPSAVDKARITGFIVRQPDPKNRGQEPRFFLARFGPLGRHPRTCYDGTMKAFVCEVDSFGLRRLLPEDLISRDELRRLAHGLLQCPTTLFWTLLADDDADDLQADIGAGRYAEACGLLLNRAVEIITLGAAALGT